MSSCAHIAPHRRTLRDRSATALEAVRGAFADAQQDALLYARRVNRKLALSVAIVAGVLYVACSEFAADAPSSDVPDADVAADGSSGDANADAGADAMDGGPRADAASVMSYRDLVLDAGPIAYWRMDIKAGTTVQDESDAASPTDLAVSLPAMLHDVGIAGGASIELVDGGHLQAGSTASFQFGNTDPFTLELWARRSPAITQAANGTLVYDGPGNGPTTGDSWYGLQLDVDAGGVRFIRGSGPGAAKTPALSFPADLKFHHFVGIYDGNTIILVVDNVVSMPAVNSTDDLTANSRTLLIGALANATKRFQGNVDEVAIYSRALPLADVKAHWERGRQP